MSWVYHLQPKFVPVIASVAKILVNTSIVTLVTDIQLSSTDKANIAANYTIIAEYHDI